MELIAPGARIERVHRFRRQPYPFPAALRLDTVDGPIDCVVKTATGQRELTTEADALVVLAELDFAAPRLLAGPTVVDTDAGRIEVLVMTRLPGDALPWFGVDDVATADRTCRLIIEAVDRLHALTPRVEALSAGSAIPRRTLGQELTDVIGRDTGWSSTDTFTDAVDVLADVLPRHEVPLVFSNGDYNPVNALADDTGLTGWVDFEHAGLEDPLIGFPKFGFWAQDSGWRLASQVGLVERYLYRHRVPPETFAVRVALRGLTHLHDSDPADPPLIMIDQIERAVDELKSRG
ncbi:phosphotransferase family protein [Microlunatus soli]|uniref:phosphotransferase family protein n=1 Tax=Microlunatus soli TaxID=630515 RepID=UPI0012FC4DCC|nr:phosphotransferase [Microlunatus soli]